MFFHDAEGVTTEAVLNYFCIRTYCNHFFTKKPSLPGPAYGKLTPEAIMIVKFYSTLREIVGQKTVEFDLHENVTVRQLVDEVIRQYPSMKRELVDDEGNLYQHVHVIVNGRDVPFLNFGEISSEERGVTR